MTAMPALGRLLLAPLAVFGAVLAAMVALNGSATSPPALSAGGTPRLSLIVSTAGGPWIPRCWLRSGMPWSSACTMSVRSSSGAPTLNSAFITAASSGFTTYLP